MAAIALVNSAASRAIAVLPRHSLVVLPRSYFSRDVSHQAFLVVGVARYHTMSVGAESEEKEMARCRGTLPVTV